MSKLGIRTYEVHQFPIWLFCSAGDDISPEVKLQFLDMSDV